MTLLIVYILIALVFSFLCSIAESVLLSISPAHIAVMEEEERQAGALLKQLKSDVSQPLAAILTLNTIAHTLGAAGAGAQATVVFGSGYLGVISAVLTLLILVFSEIIPKTLGAHYWRQLAAPTAYGLKFLIWILYPFVKLSGLITGRLSDGPNLDGFSREEFAVMADLSLQEGQLGQHESNILKNVLRLGDLKVRNVMTPRTVIFSLSEEISVQQFFYQHDDVRFSRIPIYSESKDEITGFVLRTDLLLAQARGNTGSKLKNYSRDIPAILETSRLNTTFQKMLKEHLQIMLIVDEYGSTEGIVTQEDVFETILGLEIVDEGDGAPDMQVLARQLWRKRASAAGLNIDLFKD